MLMMESLSGMLRLRQAAFKGVGGLIAALGLFSLAATTAADTLAAEPRLDHASGDTLRIGTFLSAIDYAPFYIAQQNGCADAVARRHGRVVRYEVYHATGDMNAAVNSGALDIILEADTPAILQRAAGTDIREITPLAALSQQILTPAHTDARGLLDLKGRRIGVLFASGYHFAVVAGLSALGLAEDRYTLVDVAPTDGAASLARGDIDAWAIWPPILQQTMRTSPVKIMPGSASTLNVYAWGAGPFMRKNPSLVNAFAACIRRSIGFIKDRRAEALAITADKTGLPLRIVSDAWPTMRFGFKADPEIFRVLNDQAKFLYNHGYTPRAVHFDAADFHDLGDGE